MPATPSRHPVPRRIRMLLPAALLLVAACEESQPMATELASASVASSGAQTIQGEVGGALYEIQIPAEWNGDLVLYAHGYRDAGTPVDLRDQDNLYSIRERLSEQGYAVAYSSYSENGYAVKDGMQSTQQLRGIFAAQVGQPERTLLMGHSLGGLVALGLTERFPEHYDGALVMCGITGGSQATVNYIGNIRVLFDLFYKDVLPGDVLNIPAGTSPADVQNLATVAMTASLATGSTESLRGAVAMAAIMEGLGTPIPHITNVNQTTYVQTLVGSIVYALVFHARGFEDLIERTHGHSPFDNTATVYGDPSTPLGAWVNTEVERYSSTPDAQNYLWKYYQPTGNLQIPVVTLNNPFDPIAPSFHAERYGNQVGEAGQSQHLTARSTSNPFAYGHCAISVDDTMAAFAELATRAAD